MIKSDSDSLNGDYSVILKSQYPNAAKEIDASILELLIEVLLINVFVDSNRAHNLVTQKFITGLIILLGRTPLFFQRK